MKKINTAQRLEKVPEYFFARLAKEVKTVERRTGRKDLNFGPGSPDISPSKVYIQKLQRFLKDESAHRYPGYGAIPEFSDALINWYKNRFGVDIKQNEIQPLLGAKDGITHLPLALLDVNDQFLVPDPGYPAYSTPAMMLGAKLVLYDLKEENNFKFDIEQLANKITKKTKFIWINFPSNPTGQVASLSELQKLVEFAKQNSLLIAYDNAYSEITFDGFTAPSILQIKGAKNVAIELGSFSKTFSFAGYRMGWVVGNDDVINALTTIKSQMDSGISIPLQKLGACALTELDEKWQSEMLHTYNKRRKIIAEKLKSLGLKFTIPKGSLYIWAKIPKKAKSSEDFCIKLLREKQIVFTPGTAFGKNGERFVRVSICVNIDKIDQYF